MKDEMRVKLDLSYQDAHILTVMLEGSGYPHILKQLNEANRKAYTFRFWDLVKNDLKSGRWRSVFYRFKNWKSIRSKYV